MLRIKLFQSKISQRMILSFLFVSFFSISVLGLYLLNFFYQDNLQKQTAELIRNAKIAEILLADELSTPSSAERSIRLEQKIHTINAETALRLTLINDSGVVLADSSEPAESLDNHMMRPEIQGALNHTESSSIRYSDTLKENMLYAAIPVYNEQNELLGIIRTASSLTPVEAAYDATRRTLLIALAAAVLLALCVSTLLARRQLQPIQQMTEDALAISHGNLQKRLHIHTHDELELLAQTINHLTSNLAQKIHEAASAAHQQSLILKNMDNGVLLLNARGSILTANKKARELFQLTAAHLGKTSIHALGSTLLSTSAQHAAQQKESMTRTFSLSTPTGAKTFSIFFAPFPEKDEQLVLCVFHDISLLQELSHRQTEFVSNAAHELATPLTSISGFAETLLDDDFSQPELSRKFIGTIYKEAQRMSRLIKELLQLARLDQREYQQQLSLTKLEAQKFPALVQHKLQAQTRQKSQQVLLAVSPSAKGAFLKANEYLFLQLLINLTENASKYTPENGQITLSCSADKDSVFFLVKDTGIGIAANDLPFIFDRFYRSDKARSRASGGNGLGLSLVQFLVGLFDGKISVKSKLQEGTEFLLQFPRIN